MNDFLLIFIGIFILLLIFLVFLLLAYVYNSYTTYTVDINKNLSTSETNINNTSNAFNKLQDNVINELAKVNKNQEIIVKTVPNQLVSLNSNLLSMFQISSNNINNYNDITTNSIDIRSINVIKPFTTYKTFTSITDDNNLLNICNNNTDASKRACIQMNIKDDNFNIYTKNSNTSNIKNINIYDINNGILASFDTYNKNISLGSNIDPAISIKNNVYTPDTIVCKYTISKANKQITILLISNFKIKQDKYINIAILSKFQMANTNIRDRDVTFRYYECNFKFKAAAVINPGITYEETFNILEMDEETPLIDEVTTTNGYITLS
jgi:hypothetical protein